MWTMPNKCPIPFTSGPGCSKLTTSLVNVSLKFQMLISEICQYFLLKKCEKASLIFSIKNISIIGYKVVKQLKRWPLNELVKLTMLWTTGPRKLNIQTSANGQPDHLQTISHNQMCQTFANSQPKSNVTILVNSYIVHNVCFKLKKRVVHHKTPDNGQTNILVWPFKVLHENSTS